MEENWKFDNKVTIVYYVGDFYHEMLLSELKKIVEEDLKVAKVPLTKIIENINMLKGERKEWMHLKVTLKG